MKRSKQNVNPRGAGVKRRVSRIFRAFEIGALVLFALGWGWGPASPADAQTQTDNREGMNVQIGKFDGMRLYMGLNTVGRFQALEHEKVYIDGKEQPSLSSGFQTAWGNLSFLANYEDKIEVYFNLYLSSRPHPDKVYGDEGYILFRRAPENAGLASSLFRAVSIKAGAFVIDYGDHLYHRSDNARVQRNLLIGNYVIDPNSEEIGVEISTKPRRVNLLVGGGSGTTTESFKKGRGFSLHGKLWAYLADSLRVSGSVYRVDHSGNPVGSEGTRETLFSGHRSGGPYGGVLGGGNAPGQVTPGAGKKVTAAQADATWKGGPVGLYSHYGWMEDADLNGSAPGSPRESWSYFTAEAVYRLTPNLYAAARYSGASARMIKDLPSRGRIGQIQIGGGLYLTKYVLAKAEYVHQKCRNFSQADGKISGVDRWRGPVFKGVISEVSFAF